MEWLKEVLENTEGKEALEKAILEGIGKGFVPRSTFNEVNITKKALETKVSAMEGAVEGAREVEKELIALQTKLAQGEAEMEQRNCFSQLTQGRIWRDKLTEDGVYAQFQQALAQAEEGQGAEAVFEGLVTGQSYFKNPNPPMEMPPMGKVSTGVMTDNQMRVIMGLPQKV